MDFAKTLQKKVGFEEVCFEDQSGRFIPDSESSTFRLGSAKTIEIDSAIHSLQVELGMDEAYWHLALPTLFFIHFWQLLNASIEWKTVVAVFDTEWDEHMVQKEIFEKWLI